MGLVAQLVDQYTIYLGVKGPSPFQTRANPFFPNMNACANSGELKIQLGQCQRNIDQPESIKW